MIMIKRFLRTIAYFLLIISVLGNNISLISSNITSEKKESENKMIKNNIEFGIEINGTYSNEL